MAAGNFFIVVLCLIFRSFQIVAMCELITRESTSKAKCKPKSREEVTLSAMPVAISEIESDHFSIRTVRILEEASKLLDHSEKMRQPISSRYGKPKAGMIAINDIRDR